MEDRRCKLGLAGRLELVRLIESGCSFRAAAAAESSVSPATAHRWWHRWAAASEDERASLACLRTRSLAAAVVSVGAERGGGAGDPDAREKTNYGPMRLQFLTGRHRSTIWKVLARHGVSRRRRCERAAAAAATSGPKPARLLHIDAFELPKFDRPGHWATGERAERHKTRRAGTVSHRRHRRPHPAGLLRAARRREQAHRLGHAAPRRAWFRDQGCGPVEAVMSTTRSATPPATSSATPSPSSTPATS